MNARKIAFVLADTVTLVFPAAGLLILTYYLPGMDEFRNFFLLFLGLMVAETSRGFFR